MPGVVMRGGDHDGGGMVTAVVVTVVTPVVMGTPRGRPVGRPNAGLAVEPLVTSGQPGGPLPALVVQRRQDVVPGGAADAPPMADKGDDARPHAPAAATSGGGLLRRRWRR